MSFFKLMAMFACLMLFCISLIESKFFPKEHYTPNSVKSCIFVFIYYITVILLYLISEYGWGFLNSPGMVILDFPYNRLNVISEFFLILIICIYFILSFDFLKNRKDFIEYMIISLLAINAMFLLMSAEDFFRAFLYMELQTFCFYILFGLVKNESFAIESVIKYYILSIFSTGFLLFGCTLIYGFCGTTNFIEISILFPVELVLNIDGFFNFYTLGIFLFLVGILFKLAVVPFHYWIADVYEGIPLPVVCFYILTSKISYIIFLINLLGVLSLYSAFSVLLYFLSLLSIAFGTFGALYQTNLMRILAYGAINHIGFILLGISLSTKESITMSLVYLFTYIALLIGFFCTLLVFKAIGIGTVYDLKVTSLFEKSFFGFLIAIVFSSFILSFAGVPPFAGFFIKWGIFLSLAESGYYYTLVFVGFSSVVSAVYYIRMLRFIHFFKETVDVILNWKFEFSYPLFFFIIIFSFFNLFFFFFQVHLYIFLLN